eukprot:GFKZ01008722.1.p1 GENE.GFKZ01008722.1~~GFKZ01008722.1.p1  ORF type:complete len:1022 (+),score=142.39 GFKZ01008722.1:558-3623(+)
MDIDTAPPPPHHDGRPSMQLDLPVSDDVMMEVDPDLTLAPTPLTPRAGNYLPVNSTSSHHHPMSTGSPSPLHSPGITRGLDGVSSPFGSLTTPPTVLICSSDSAAWPNFKVDQLFVEWLARPESRKWLETLMDGARRGKAPEQLIVDQTAHFVLSERVVTQSPTRSSPSAQPGVSVSPQQAPGSPVSRLFRSHVPFGDSDSSPRSPPSVPLASLSTFKQSALTPGTSELDLGRSGTVSPLARDTGTAGADVELADTKMINENSGPGALTSSVQFAALTKSSGQLQSALSEFSGEQVTEEDKAIAGQLHDINTLEKVADGIAGMSADGGPPGADSQKGAEVQDGKQLIQHVQVRSRRTEPHSSQKSSGTDTGDFDSSESSTAEAKVRSSETVDTSSGLDVLSSPIKEMSAKRDSDALNTSDTAKSFSESDLHARAVPEMQDSCDQITAREDAPLAGHGGSNLVTANMPPTVPKQAASRDKSMDDAIISKKKLRHLPKFYFPCGKDAETREERESKLIVDCFREKESQKMFQGVTRTEMTKLVAEVIGLPSYFSGIVFNAISELFPIGADRVVNQTLAESERNEGAEPMRDVEPRKESDSTISRKDVSPVNNSSSGVSGTNSDTTMGDVDDVNNHRVGSNGLAHFQGASPDTENQQMNAEEVNKARQIAGSAEIVTREQFQMYYNKFCKGHSRESRLFTALREPNANRDYLVPSDFKPLLRALLMHHQGLAFLHATPEFQQRYSETVIERIYFGCTRKHNGRLTLNDIKRSKLLETLMVVDEEEDINRERKYFSYEHFYVLYCRFWELDANHDLQIDREDLMRYGSHSLTYRIVDRIFGGYARPLDCPDNPGYMSYTDFIWFCLSEEDKTSETAIDYWFRCIDMDGDGLITMYDMEYFYKEQLHRMECFGHEPVQIRDILCQLLDMINPNVRPPVIRRRDLKRCRLAGNFFNVLFNLNKFFAIEARDPLQIRQEHATPELTDWDRFAALEYLRLSAEEEGEEDESWEDVGDATNPLMAGEAPF